MGGSIKRRIGVGIAALAVVLCAVGVWAANAPAPGETEPVPLAPKESLADADGGPVTLAAEYSDDALAKFESVMHIEDAEGNQLALGDVPASDYSGFIFKVKSPAEGAGDVSAMLAEAAGLGLVSQIADDLYQATSLDALAGLLDVSQVAYVEPNFNLRLIGEVDSASSGGDPSATPFLGSTQDGGGALEPGGDGGDIVAAAEVALSAMGGTDQNPAPDWPPTDQYYLAGKLWNLDMLNVQVAWEKGLDGDPYVYNSTAVRDAPVRVAIIDTGLYGTGAAESQHEDFDYGKIEIGYDWINQNRAGAPDAKGHGTFVAGLIGAKVSNEGVGVAGIMPNVTLVPEKVFDTGSATTANVISAIYHASGYYNDAGTYGTITPVDVINMSLGGEYNESSLEEACDYAVEQGILVVASAGNDGVSTPNYPAAYDSVVGVASVNSSRERSSWSQYGVSVYVTAPGESVTSTYNEGADSYTTASGTSFSGPEVAALAAMCKSVYPDIDQDTFKMFLRETSHQLDSATDQGEWNQNFGYGLVDFGDMATAVLDSQTLPWYDLTFDVVDANGEAVSGAAVTVSAAEDIAWEADDSAIPAIEAGSWSKGTEIASENSVWKVHRGNYDYKVVAPGYYTVTGTLKTFAADQLTTVKMQTAYQATVNVVDSSGASVPDAQLSVSSAQRVEEPKTQLDGVYTYDLAPGSYGFQAEPADDAYEPAAGAFVMEHAAASFDAVLYRADELATVRFEVRSEADDSLLERNVGLAVADSSGVIVAPQDDGAYRLAKGKGYTVTATKVGFDTTEKGFTVDGSEGEQVVSVVMKPGKNRIVFNVVDEGGNAVGAAAVKVADASGAVVDPSTTEGAYVFSLPAGAYTYEVSAPGYEGKQGTLNVSTSGDSITIALKAVPQEVGFNVVDAETGSAIQGASIKVSTDKDKRTIAGNDGVWRLSPGTYRYTVYKQGYEAAQGTFTVGGAALSVDVGLAVKSGGTTQFAGGSGTADDPYLIATEDQLRYLAEGTEIVRMTDSSAETNQHNLMGGYYKLIDDIELTREWYPIGNEESSSNYFRFAGHFDGNGHTVSNVYINQPTLDYQGFFGSVVGATVTEDGEQVGATISNLTVKGPGISGGSYVGGLVGRVYYYNSSEYPSWNTLSTTISQCGSELDVSGKYAVGGIVGSAQGTDQDSVGKDYDTGSAGGIYIVSCYNTGTITAAQNGSFTKGNSSAGGIVGSAQQVRVQDCYNTGDVQAGYNAGGLAGNARRCTLHTSYNSGKVVQHIKAPGYENTAGGVMGNAYYTLASDCYFLLRDDSTNKVACGSPDTASSFTNCLGKAYEDMYRTSSFVALVNSNAATGVVGDSFVLGRDFPLLSWQAAAGALLAPMPRIVMQPQGVEPAHAYKQGDAATPLTAQAEQADDDEGTLTWAWYVADSATGMGATAIEGAAGTGELATCTPSTAEVGARHYFCLFTNAVSSESAYDEATARTDTATVYVRSVTDAQRPVITKLNPSQTSAVNTSMVVKAGTGAHLTAQAEVGDGGELSYQWYAESDTGASVPIEGATGMSYDAPTSAQGEFHYWVGVTNTLEAGNEASTMSDRITVTVAPYTIESYEDLAAFQSQVNGGNSFANIMITLTDDVRIPDGVDWTPIGTPTAPFQGVFMGGSGYAETQPEKVVTHKITNLNVDGDAHGNCYLGLFGYTQDALIFDVQVQGSITGEANTDAGLLVGYASTYNTSTGYAYIENCATLPGSSVEGKYRIAGLVGGGGSNLNNCANHADVHAHAFPRETASTTAGWWSVGGVTAFANGTGELMGCYNTGAITVNAVGGANDYCAEYVGGVAGFTGAHSGVYSSFNAGAVDVGTVAPDPLTYRGKVRYAGSLAGYIAYGNCANVHYLEGTYATGANDDAGSVAVGYHSYTYFKGDYFLNQLATGYAKYAPSHFAKSERGVPRYLWEDEGVNANPDDEGGLYTSEPRMIDVQSEDMPKITSTWQGTYFQGGFSSPVYLLAESTDGGDLAFFWQSRDPSDPDAASWGFDDGWGEYFAADVTTRTYGGKEYQAGAFTVPVAEAGDMQYRLVVRSVLEDALPEEDGHGKESATNPISISVLDPSQGIFLENPNDPNSADNPWVIDTPTRMKFFADLVNGKASLPGLDDAMFKGQYVKLYDDIDLSSFDNWDPIGGYGSGRPLFKGIFDGDGYKVTNLRIDRQGTAVLDNAPWYPDDYSGVGLFGAIGGATIRNLEVQGSVYLDNWRTGSTTTQAWMTGGIVGYAYGSYIENCVSRVDVAGWQGVGGIAGTAEATAIIDCENMGAVRTNDTSQNATSGYGGFQVGGIVGCMKGAAAAEYGAGVYNCYNGGSVVGRLWDGAYNSGAIVGQVEDARVQDTYYLAGSITCDNSPSARMTGVGTTSTRPLADAAGTCLSIADADSPGTAWALNMSPVNLKDNDAFANSRRWGDYARTDLGDASPKVHLVRGAEDLAIHRVDTASPAASVTAAPEFATAGTPVQVAWTCKAGFEVSSVGWTSDAEGDAGGTLGTGNKGSGSFTMPAGDVTIVVDAAQDTGHYYAVSAVATYKGEEAPTAVGSASLSDDRVLAGGQVDLKLAVQDGYQVKSVTAVDAYGDEVAVSRVDGLNYTVTAGAADVTVTVAFEDVGTPVAEGDRADSLAVNRAGLHSATESARVYHTPDLLYDMVVFSGSYFGSENWLMTYELESSSTAQLFEQAYSVDGEDMLFTGVDLALLIHSIGGSEPPAPDAPVRIETGTGAVYECAYGDLTALTYNRYDATGQPIERGLPVLLFFGVDDVPNTQGGVGVVFGETAPFKKVTSNGASIQPGGLKAQEQAGPSDGGAVVLYDVTRISVASAAGRADVNYSQHSYSPYDDLTWVDGGELNGEYGQSNLHIRIYREGDGDNELLGERVISVTSIEKMANEDVAGAQRGNYSVMLYEDGEEASDGIYNDYYEGYDLYKVLQWAGVPYEPDAKVQFYQSGMYGLDRSWKTVNVSLGYLAGNGPEGEGDYSNNTMTFKVDKDGASPPAGAGASLTGVRPMIAYGKNGLPLVWDSGKQTYGKYNYRGPMMAFLPQNAVEGGSFVGTQSVMSCYLGLIDVVLPESAEEPDIPDDPDDSNGAGGNGGTGEGSSTGGGSEGGSGSGGNAGSGGTGSGGNAGTGGSGTGGGSGSGEAGGSGSAGGSSSSAPATQQMYRLYNPNSGEHFYTADAAERDIVRAAGWDYEGVGWTAPMTGDPVFRLYNKYGGEHHYTLSADERVALVEAGWNDEGVGWCSAPGSTGVPLYRQYNPNAFSCNHNYTVSAEESNWLVGLGWHYEGVAWYGVKTPEGNLQMGSAAL